jgi:hypothetical protein
VNIASEMSKWLLECEPQVSRLSRQVCATRTEPCMVQKPDLSTAGHLADAGVAGVV